MHKFNIGDELFFIRGGYLYENYYCILRGYSAKGLPKVEFFSTGKLSRYYSFGHSFGIFELYNESDYILAKPALTQEERLLNKCKKLWNNSNYVLNNPQRAY